MIENKITTEYKTVKRGSLLISHLNISPLTDIEETKKETEKKVQGESKESSQD